jgi:hypothetical protein
MIPGRRSKEKGKSVKQSTMRVDWRIRVMPEDGDNWPETAVRPLFSAERSAIMFQPKEVIIWIVDRMDGDVQVRKAEARGTRILAGKTIEARTEWDAYNGKFPETCGIPLWINILAHAIVIQGTERETDGEYVELTFDVNRAHGDRK